MSVPPFPPLHLFELFFDLLALLPDGFSFGEHDGGMPKLGFTAEIEGPEEGLEPTVCVKIIARARSTSAA